MNPLKKCPFIESFKSGLLVTMAIIAVSGLSPRLSNAGEIDWTIAPYFWASDVGLDVAVNSDPILGADVPLKDLIDKLDGVFMGHVEGRGERFGAFVDTIYLSLSDSNVIPTGPGGPILGDLTTDMDLTLKLYELGGVYRIGGDSAGSAAFDVLLGARLVDVDQNLDLILPGPGATPANLSIAISETDVFLGGRLIGKFNDKWHYKARADFGGGGTDGTFNILGAIGYTFGETGLFSLDLGYRYMTIELENDRDGTSTETDITLSGPLLGFIFNF
ncbi:MAG: hypothetical protein ACI88G_001691 [Woeseiaceae bacterium]|jgi:hypothetical protein